MSYLGTSGTLGIYSDGSDGTVVISVNTSLSRSMFYENLTINSGVTLTLGTYMLFVRNKLTFADNTSIIDSSGNNGATGGAGGAGGAGITSVVVGTNTAGGSGSQNSGLDGPVLSNALGGSFGGNGGDDDSGIRIGGFGTFATPPSTAVGSVNTTFAYPFCIMPHLAGTSKTAKFNGGGGGGGGGGDTVNFGGGGGAGGAVVLCFAKTIIGDGIFRSRGGNGGIGSAGNAGGGGGGSGGYVLVVTDTPPALRTFTMNADAGVGGAAAGIGNPGQDGTPGITVILGNHP